MAATMENNQTQITSIDPITILEHMAAKVTFNHNLAFSNILYMITQTKENILKPSQIDILKAK